MMPTLDFRHWLATSGGHLHFRQTGCESGLLMTLPLGLITLLERFTELRETLTD